MTSPTSTTKPRRTRMLAAAGAILMATALLAGCTSATPAPAATAAANQTSNEEFLAEHDLTGLDTKQVIDRLDTMAVADRPDNLIASVKPDALMLTDTEDRVAEMPMPRDEVYISVAPYREQTHDCYFHSLTTCRGEMSNTEIQVTLTGADGSVLIDEAQTTYDNGFVGLWVPRGVEATLTVTQDGKSGTVPISTVNDDDPTCITTLQLT